MFQAQNKKPKQQKSNQNPRNKVDQDQGHKKENFKRIQRKSSYTGKS